MIDKLVNDGSWLWDGATATVASDSFFRNGASTLMTWNLKTAIWTGVSSSSTCSQEESGLQQVHRSRHTQPHPYIYILYNLIQFNTLLCNLYISWVTNSPHRTSIKKSTTIHARWFLTLLTLQRVAISSPLMRTRRWQRPVLRQRMKAMAKICLEKSLWWSHTCSSAEDLVGFECILSANPHEWM